MGNQLVGIAPSQILPVERYLTDYSTPDMKFIFEASLGSTRFLKVARASIENQEGHVVVKVFAIHDPSLLLSSYKDRLKTIKDSLVGAVNCIPFQKCIIHDKAAFMIREYVKYSLYDRLSTRPFLTNIEKRWITFQILYALHQCHKVGVCHGDIKLENITVTSWNWVLLVDFASFKPTFLPAYHPADYSYFFDTSRRRTCYIAPERFTDAASEEDDSNLVLLHESSCDNLNLTPAMDIFSAGCALLELWNETSVPFEYSQLLGYRTKTYSPQFQLNKLGDPSLISLITSMIDLDPKKRLSAEDYLAQERGKLFPEYFFSFLQSYMLIFSSNPILTPDEKILRLKSDIKNIFKFLGTPESEGGKDGCDLEKEKCDTSKLDEENEKHCEGLVLITSLVTSCIRGLVECSSKLYSLEILLELAVHANDETILDRILPHIMYLVQDADSRVKVSAISTVTKCLSLVKKVPKSDLNVFPEYILPGLSVLAMDSNTCVRVAYAKHVGDLAELSVRYLDQVVNASHNHQYDDIAINYDLEWHALHDMVQQSVSLLLSDSQSIVKQTLMESGVTKLCVFFGKIKANDIILSHMITFLNDKEDRELRGTFFDCIVGVASFIGWHCEMILTPLLLQGLTDSDEFVTRKCVNAMSELTGLGLINKHAQSELVSECACFLVHPSLWLRQAVAGFIATVATSMTILDVQVKVLPKIKRYMKYSLIQIDRPELILEALVEPIPRSIYDSVATFGDIDSLLEHFVLKKRFRDAVKDGRIISNIEVQTTLLKNIIRRLESTGLTDQFEEFICDFSSHLKKIHQHKVNPRHGHQTEGKLEIESSTSDVKSYVFNLNETPKAEYITTESLAKQSDSGQTSGILSGSSSQTLSPQTNTQGKKTIQKCYIELMNLKAKQQEHYLQAVKHHEWAEQTAWQPQLPPPGWHLRGILVAHLHEHKAAVTKLCALPETPFFASSSLDGTVKVWDCKKMEAKSIANTSKQYYKMEDGSQVIGVVPCEGGKSLAAASRNGSINVLRMDSASHKMILSQSTQLCPDTEGFPVDIQCLDSGSQSVVVYATVYGSIIGWDLRCPGSTWRLENRLQLGFITSFCLDPHQNWLTLGTRQGYHVVWDLRFRLPITEFPHPGNSPRIRKVVAHPTDNSCVISSVQGINEISIWNLETTFREKVLWGSTTPFSPLLPKNQQEQSHSICAMLAGSIESSPFLLAGGTDQRIRCWDLQNSNKSHLAVPAATDHVGTTLQYNTRLIDGINVTYEECSPPVQDPEEVPQAGPEPPPVGHKDSISDIIFCKANQLFVATSSRDGIIKVWK